MYAWGRAALCAGIAVLLAGCPKGKTDFKMGHQEKNLQDYDAAVQYYQEALKTDPKNTEYQIKFNHARFNAAEMHTKNGFKLRERGDLACIIHDS